MKIIIIIIIILGILFFIYELIFTDKSNSKNQQANNLDNKNKKFRCKYCKEFFSSLSGARSHIKEKHLIFKCNFCNFSSYRDEELKTHLEYFKRQYEILGINERSDQKEIKRAFRALAKKKHPDITKNPADEEEFKKISEAYEILSNPNNKH